MALNEINIFQRRIKAKAKGAVREAKYFTLFISNESMEEKIEPMS